MPRTEKHDHGAHGGHWQTSAAELEILLSRHPLGPPLLSHVWGHVTSCCRVCSAQSIKTHAHTSGESSRSLR